jgi:hypothetical protein
MTDCDLCDGGNSRSDLELKAMEARAVVGRLVEIGGLTAQEAELAVATAGMVVSKGRAGKTGLPSAGGGAKLNNLSTDEIARIQNAANRTGIPITVVGSRAGGTSGALSDWDYDVPSGTRASTIHSLKSSLPSGHRGIGEVRNLEINRGTINASLPHIIFTPK